MTDPDFYAGDPTRAVDPSLMRFAETDAGPVLEGRMMPYGEWTEIKDSFGHYMERFAPGSLAKTMKERGRRIQVMFEHGLDRSLGKQAIAQVESMEDLEDGAHYRATLLPGVPELLVEGLRRGLYGSSVTAKPMAGKYDIERRPEPSDANPDGIPEVTIREAYLHEFSVVPFPAYQGATALVRSVTDDLAVKRLLQDPVRLLELIRSTSTIADEPEPNHSVPNAPEPADTPPADPEPQGSRSTQPTRDYLADEEGTPAWRLQERQETSSRLS